MLSKSPNIENPKFSRDIKGQLDKKITHFISQQTGSIRGKSNEKNNPKLNAPSFNINSIAVLPPQPAAVQPKLAISAPRDKFEKEADRVADLALKENTYIPANQSACPLPHFIQPKHTAFKAGEGLSWMCKSTNIDELEVSPYLTSLLNNSKDRGNPLPENIRLLMENTFKSDFSRVNIHTDDNSAMMSQAIQARAFTNGQDIYFNQGEYNPSNKEGKRLLAHELVHTIQQTKTGGVQIQRAAYGGIATGVPSDWSTQVSSATNSSAKAVLVQTAVGSTVRIEDRTAESRQDTSPTPSHLLPFTASSPTVNFDDNLNSKTARGGRRSLSANAGYTFTERGVNYVILGNKALNGNSFYSTLLILNHELDHVRQNIAGSRLTGNASEVDAWTSSFIREFHRMYLIRDNGTTCFIDDYQPFAPLIGYYERATSSEQQSACGRIIEYFNNIIRPHAAHLKVFRWWIRRTLGNSPNSLAVHLNTQLRLGINASERLANYRQFPCTGITNLTYPAAPTPDLPRFPSTGSRKR